MPTNGVILELSKKAILLVVRYLNIDMERFLQNFLMKPLPVKLNQQKPMVDGLI